MPDLGKHYGRGPPTNRNSDPGSVDEANHLIASSITRIDHPPDMKDPETTPVSVVDWVLVAEHASERRKVGRKAEGDGTEFGRLHIC